MTPWDRLKRQQPRADTAHRSPDEQENEQEDEQEQQASISPWDAYKSGQTTRGSVNTPWQNYKQQGNWKSASTAWVNYKQQTGWEYQQGPVYQGPKIDKLLRYAQTAYDSGDQENAFRLYTDALKRYDNSRWKELLPPAQKALSDIGAFRTETPAERMLAGNKEFQQTVFEQGSQWASRAAALGDSAGAQKHVNNAIKAYDNLGRIARQDAKDAYDAWAAENPVEALVERNRDALNVEPEGMSGRRGYLWQDLPEEIAAAAEGENGAVVLAMALDERRIRELLVQAKAQMEQQETTGSTPGVTVNDNGQTEIILSELKHSGRSHVALLEQALEYNLQIKRSQDLETVEQMREADPELFAHRAEQGRRRAERDGYDPGDGTPDTSGFGDKFMLWLAGGGPDGDSDEEQEMFYALYEANPELAKDWLENRRAVKNAAYYSDVANEGKGNLIDHALAMGRGLIDKTLGALAPKTDVGQIFTRRGNAILGGAAEDLNDTFGTLPDEIPIVGGKGAGDLYQLGESMARSGIAAYLTAKTGDVNALYGAFTEMLNLTMMGREAAASDYVEQLDRGIDPQTAWTHACAAGTAEMFFEQFSLEALVNTDLAKTSFKEIFKSVFKQGLTEGSEEVFTSLANRVSDELILRSKGYESTVQHRAHELMEQGMSEADANVRAEREWLTDVINDGLGGFLSGAGMGGMAYAGSGAYSAAWQNYQTTRLTDKDYAEIAAEAQDAGALETLQLYAADNGLDFDAKAKGAQLGRNVVGVTNHIAQQMGGKPLQEIETVYTQTVEQYGDGIRQAVNSAAVQPIQQALTADSGDNAAQRVAYRAQVETLTDDSFKQLVEQTYQQKLFGNAFAEAAKTGDTTQLEALIRANRYGGRQGESVDLRASYANESGETVQSEFRSLNDEGQAVLADGKVLPVSELEMDADTADILGRITRLELGKDANAVWTAYQEAVKADPAINAYGWLADYATAYYDGRSGMTLAQTQQDVPGLPLNELAKAYDLGKQAKQTRLAQREAQYAQAKTEAQEKGVAEHEGTLTVSEKIDQKSLSKQQKEDLEITRRLSEASGVDFVIVASETEVDEDAREIYKGAHGWYKDGTIYLDINAGKTYVSDSIGCLMAVTGHEMVHFMKAFAETEFAAYKAAVLQAIRDLEGRKTLDRLISEQQKKGLSHEEAEDEVVADASQQRLGDREFWQALSENLGEKRQGVLEKLKTWLKDWFGKIRAALDRFKGSSGYTEAARILDRAEADVQAGLRELYARGIQKAVETHRQIGNKNTATEGGVQHMAREQRSDFEKDKYFDRQIDKWSELHDGSRVKVGELNKASALNKVGFPAAGMWFDVGKIKKSMDNHSDHLTHTILKQIPKLLNEPIAITEYRGPKGDINNTVTVYGIILPDGKTPVSVGIMMVRSEGAGLLINKVRTIHARSNAQISDDNILYLNENKKRTQKWFQVCGISVPLNATKFGLIRSIEYVDKNVKQQFSDRDYLAAVERGDMETAQKMVDEAARKAGYTIHAYHGTQADFNVFHGGAFFTDDYFLADGYASGERVIDAYLKLKNPLEIDAKGAKWDELDSEYGRSTRDVAFNLDDQHDGVIFYNVADSWMDDEDAGEYTVYYVKDSSQAKSADPVTYDDNGNVIPLSERFNPENEDIRYSDRDYTAISDEELLRRTSESDTTNEEQRRLLRDFQKLRDEKQRILGVMNDARKTEAALVASGGSLTETRAMQRDLQKRVDKLNEQLNRKLNLPLLQQLLKTEREKAAAEMRARKEQQFQAYKDRKSATELRRRIGNLKDDLSRRLTHPTDRSYVPAGLATTMVDLLDSIDNSPREGTKAAAKYESASEALRALADAYEGLSKEDDFAFASEYQEEIRDEIRKLAETLKGRNLRELSAAELQQVYDAVKGIRDTLRDATKLLNQQNYASVAEAIRAVAEQQTGMKPLTDVNGHERNKRLRLLDNLNVMRAVEMMSGWDRSSALYQIVHAVEQGVVDADGWVMRFNKRFQELKTGKNERAYRDALTKQIDMGVKDKNGRPVKLTRLQALQLVLTWEREAHNDKLVHLQRGGAEIRDALAIQDGKGAKANVWTVSVDAELIDSLRQQLSRWNKSWVDGYTEALRDYFKEESRAVNDVYRVLKHGALASEQFYVPYSVSKDYLDAKLENADVYNIWVKQPGATNALQKMAPQPVVIDGIDEILNKHVRDMANYIGLALPIRDFAKVFNGRIAAQEEGEVYLPLKKTIADNFGDKGTDLLVQAMLDVQGGSRTQSWRASIAEHLNKLQGAFVKSALLINPSVTIKQAASYAAAMSVLDYRALVAGNRPIFTSTDSGHSVSLIAQLFAAPSSKTAQRIYNEIDEHTSMHYQRRLGMSQTELAAAALRGGKMKRLTGNIGASLEQSKAGHMLRTGLEMANPITWIQRMDVATTAALWVACKEQARIDGVKVDSEEYWQHVTELYEQVLRETQPMYDSLHRSANQKSDGLMKYLFPFRTVPIQNHGQIATAYEALLASKGQGKAAQRAAWWHMVKTTLAQTESAVIFAVMTFLAAAMKRKTSKYRDEDEEFTPWSIAGGIGQDVLSVWVSNIFPVFGSEAYSLAQRGVDKFTGKSGRSFDAFSVGVVDMLNDVGSAGDKLIKAAGRLIRGEDVSWAEIGDDALAIMLKAAKLAGIPAETVRTYWQGMRGNVDDILAGRIPAINDEAVKRSATVNAGRYLEAYEAADAEKMEAVLDEMRGSLSEDAMRNALSATAKEQREAGWTLEQTVDFLRATGAFSEKQITNKALDYLKEDYLAGEITEDEAIKTYLQYKPDKDEDYAYWKLREWEAKAEHTEDEDEDDEYKWNKYEELYAAIDGNQDASAAIRELTENGVKESDVKQQAKEYIMEQFETGAYSEEKVRNYLSRYCGIVKTDDVDELIRRSRCYMETGVRYNNLKAAFQEGDLSEEQTKRALVKYGLMSGTDAEHRVHAWDFQKLHAGLDWDVDAVEDYLYKTPKEGSSKSAQQAGISAEVWDQWLQKKKGLDRTRANYLPIINSLNLTRAQKDWLYYKCGFAASTIGDAPWR